MGLLKSIKKLGKKAIKATGQVASIASAVGVPGAGLVATGASLVTPSPKISPSPAVRYAPSTSDVAPSPYLSGSLSAPGFLSTTEGKLAVGVAFVAVLGIGAVLIARR